MFFHSKKEKKERKKKHFRNFTKEYVKYKYIKLNNNHTNVFILIFFHKQNQQLEKMDLKSKLRIFQITFHITRICIISLKHKSIRLLKTHCSMTS